LKNYGAAPHLLGNYSVDAGEMFLYQYLPIKLVGSSELKYEERLKIFDEIIGRAACDFIGVRGLDEYVESYIYVTAKRMFVKPGCGYNRGNFHSDSFGTNEINYIWSDKFPTIFNRTLFKLPDDDRESLLAMAAQAAPRNDYSFKEGDLLRLTELNIHKVAPITEVCMRTFIKISFSKNKWALVGNSKNFLLSYNWEMATRSLERNIP
jgi:hypothetical protein